MFGDDMNRDSFEEMIRAIAQEVSRSAERVSQVDVDEIAEAIGVDPARARQWVEGAGSWLRSQAENLGDDVEFPSASPFPTRTPPPSASPSGATTEEDTLSSAGPHPLDLPTGEQGLALAALDSGRWTVEPGSNALAAHGEGPGPRDALGLVRELSVRDWIAADGKVTVVGRHALTRWLGAAAAG
jgi:hypothetical protein